MVFFKCVWWKGVYDGCLRCWGDDCVLELGRIKGEGFFLDLVDK